MTQAIATAAPCGPLMETFKIARSDGKTWEGSLYQTQRRTGRRIIVRDLTNRAVVFDTFEQYDLGNATNRVSLWLEEQEEKV